MKERGGDGVDDEVQVIVFGGGNCIVNLIINSLFNYILHTTMNYYPGYFKRPQRRICAEGKGGCILIPQLQPDKAYTVLRRSRKGDFLPCVRDAISTGCVQIMILKTAVRPISQSR